MQDIVTLIPVIKDYDWGSSSYIKELLSSSPVKDIPPVQAELWMGAHKNGCNTVLETSQSLRDFLDENPSFAAPDFKKGDDFPFLLKLLAINRPLSIQCHPDAQKAKEGFESGNPNYTDPNEKSEMFYALKDTKMLCGLRKTYTKDEESEALHSYLESYFPGDSSTDYAYRLNIMNLEEGDAVAIKAGVLHAYCSGCGIELMTNSDNVVRAGLTSKRVDKAELDKIVLKKPYIPSYLGSYEDGGGEHFYMEAGPILSVLKDGYFFENTAVSARIVFCFEGSAVINESYNISKGQVCMIRAGVPISAEVEGTLFTAYI
ncbi:MAG: class I mannose-6-phosphate isomerase [Sphaerochaetaceae bacterium]|nr:class I mannose-6-phosphate isomerase [Sphaerochaetaceae bacterium]